MKIERMIKVVDAILGDDYYCEGCDIEDDDFKGLPCSQCREKIANEVIRILRQVKETQPLYLEQIRCKDCEHRNGDYCHRFHDGYSAFIHHDDFCSYAQKKTNTATTTATTTIGIGISTYAGGEEDG